MFNVNLSLFKGLYYFVLDTNPIESLVSQHSSRSHLSLARRENSGAGSSRPIEEEKFMLFLKDDVRPFVLALLHTRSFKVHLSHFLLTRE